MKLTFLILCLTITLFSKEYINLGKFKDDKMIFKENNILKLTDKFLGVKYISNGLSNQEIDTSKENLIINFDALDCFTFIDTIEALKKTDNLRNFREKLISTRYKNSDISYKSRNHFFSDWSLNNSIIDITCKLGRCNKTIKYLNQNEKYLKKIPTVKRVISYIKPKDIDISLLKNGDYVGIYTNKKGLDVTHTGIIIKKDNKIFIRHASSLKKKIIDSELFEYSKNKLGLIIYRSI